MKRRQPEKNAPFQTIDATSRITGLSRDFIRRGVKTGEIPAIKIGSSSNAPYMIDMELFLEQLHHAAEQGFSHEQKQKAASGAGTPKSGRGDRFVASDAPQIDSTTHHGRIQAQNAQILRHGNAAADGMAIVSPGELDGIGGGIS